MDGSQWGKHVESWLFSKEWFKKFNTPAKTFIFGIVPWDFWHIAKYCMWLSMGTGIVFLLKFYGATWINSLLWGYGVAFGQGAFFLFWFHAGLYKNVIERVKIYLNNMKKRFGEFINLIEDAITWH